MNMKFEYPTPAVVPVRHKRQEARLKAAADALSVRTVAEVRTPVYRSETGVGSMDLRPGKGPKPA